jgi:MOSC domain-containing protein YiiM
MRLLAVNRATPRLLELRGRRRRTAIAKVAVDGPVAVGRLGLEGDRVASTRHHGGPDQAVYAYGADDYRWWEAELGRPLEHAMFGENLTIDLLGAEPLHVGDRLRVGREVVLEVTSPRIPCATLASRIGDPQFVKRFAAAHRPGPYLRVIVSGSVQAGDDVDLDRSHRSALSLAAAVDLFFDRRASAERLRAALAAPVAIRERTDLEERLARTEHRSP